MRGFPTASARLVFILASICAVPGTPSVAQVTPPGTAIVNVATSEARFSPGGEGPLQVQSNRVVTIVAALHELSLTLAVAPDTTVPPGTGLTYRLHYTSLGTADLTDLQIRLPLDPGLPAPDGYTGSGPGPPAAGILDATYDAAAHEVRWELAPLAAGSSGDLDVRVTVPPAIAEDTVLTVQGSGAAAELGAPILSNPVQVFVIAPVLTLAKRADRETATLGDSVGYRVTLGNTSQATELSGVEVHDVLPAALRYATGTATLDGMPLEDPEVGAEGRQLRFALPPLPPGSEMTLGYRARVGPGAEREDAVNTAVATALTASGGRLAAGPARAAVRIEGGLFSGESIVLGRVYADRDGDGAVSPGDFGIPGVRLLLEDGTYVHTDVVGKYHIEGIRPGLHVLRLDASTLPPGTTAVVQGNRSAMDADTRFLDLIPDDLFKANFPVRPPPGVPFAGLQVFVDHAAKPAVVLAPGAFVVAGRPLTSFPGRVEEVARYLRDLGLHPERVQVVAEDGAHAGTAAQVEEALSRVLRTRDEREPEPGARAGPLPAAAIRGMPADLAILSPEPDTTVPTSSGEVVVRVPLPSRPYLEVNGRELPGSQIATSQVWEQGGIGVYSYLNVGFREGANVLRLRARTDAGPSGDAVEVTVFRAGAPAFIEVEALPTPADGLTEAVVRLWVLDLSGHPVPDETLVTVRADDGEIAGIDVDPARDGFQVRTLRGLAEVRLPPSTNAAERRLYATSGLASGEGVVPFVAAGGDWVVAGLAEARFGSDAVGGLEEVDGARIGEDPDPNADGRVALFARGSVAGDHVLTFAYDNDRPDDPDRVFQEIPPDRFYPAYGDSSQQAYAAQTSGKLFARWEHQGSAALWGDYNTGLTQAELTRYDRNLYGAKADVRVRGFGVQAFGADTPYELFRDEIPGAGVSGPYVLRRRPIVVNSERIHLEVRDRFQTERILSVTEMVRYTDYDIDYVDGEILFKQPVAAWDANFNPVVIVVLYESDDAGGEHQTVGGRLSYRLGDKLDVGGTYVVEGHDAGDYTLGGADLTYRPLPGVRLHGEYARSEDPLGLSGDALAFEGAWNIGGRAEIVGYYRDLRPGYTNESRSGALQEGTRKFGIEGTVRMADRLRIRGLAFSQEDRLTGYRREVAEAHVEKDFGRVLATGGYRFTSQNGGNLPDASASSLLGGARVHITRRLDGIVEHDEVLGDEAVAGYPSRTRLGVEYLLPDGSRAFLHQEFEHGDDAVANRTLAGVETRLSERTVLTGAYTLEDGSSGQANRANVGLNTRIPLSALWTANLFGERVATLDGDPAADFTSLGAGFEYLPDGVKFSGRYEARIGELDTTHLLTAAGVLKLGPRYTLFLRERVFLLAPEAGPRDLDHDLLTGIAFRPVATDKFNWLARVELNGEGGVSTVGRPEGEAISGSFALNVEPAPRWLLTSKVAARQVTETVESGGLRTRTGLAQVRIGYDLTPRWNVGAAARLLTQPESGLRETGLGVEAGYLVWKNLWIVGGYNVTGFDDAGFREASESETGPYLAVRFKFDEASLAALTR
ncbi:MAG: hypothetical protein PVF68_11185 [Acidobacteriota bacterium]|jgi:uncharacterized repeat protein (TIGR01451 family)